MTRPRLHRPDPISDLIPAVLPENPTEVLGLVHELEAQAARTTSPEVRRQLLQAGCQLLDAALKELQLPEAA